MARSVMTVGIGRSAAMGGCNLAEIEMDLRRVREQYNAPDDAKFCAAAPGSTKAFELIWIAVSDD